MRVDDVAIRTGTVGDREPSQQIDIRRARPADAAAVLRLMTDFADGRGEVEHLTVTEDRWRVLLDWRDVIVLLARQDGRAIGYVRMRVGPAPGALLVRGDILAVDDLYVPAAARNAGVGHRLMRALAEEGGVDVLLKRGEVATCNQAAHRFYRRLGARLEDTVVARWTPPAG